MASRGEQLRQKYRGPTGYGAGAIGSSPRGDAIRRVGARSEVGKNVSRNLFRSANARLATDMSAGQKVDAASRALERRARRPQKSAGKPSQGGALARGAGGGGLQKVVPTPEGASGKSAVDPNKKGGGKRASGQLVRTGPVTAPSAGGRDRTNRNAAIRTLMNRGATEGERTAAANAAKRLGL